jgi:hypothetical protein
MWAMAGMNTLIPPAFPLGQNSIPMSRIGRRGNCITVRIPCASADNFTADAGLDSPAVCPSGWHTGKVLTGWISGDVSTSMVVGSDTSAILCCPS